jgi:hypothetical protein
MARALNVGDRVKITAKVCKRYGSMTMTSGVLVGQVRHHYGTRWRVIHDDGWQNDWNASDLEHISPLEELATALNQDET